MELNKLVEGLRTFGNEYRKVAKHIGTKSIILAGIRSPFYRDLPNTDKKLFLHVKNILSDEEVAKLVEGRLNFGLDWQKITSHIGGAKNIDQVKDKYS